MDGPGSVAAPAIAEVPGEVIAVDPPGGIGGEGHRQGQLPRPEVGRYGDAQGDVGEYPDRGGGGGHQPRGVPDRQTDGVGAGDGVPMALDRVEAPSGIPGPIVFEVPTELEGLRRDIGVRRAAGGAAAPPDPVEGLRNPAGPRMSMGS